MYNYPTVGKNEGSRDGCVGAQVGQQSGGPGNEDELRSHEIDAALSRIFPRWSIRRVLLVNPPGADASLYDQAAANRFRYSVYPPYGLLLLARHMLDAGIECQVLDLNYRVVQTCFERPEGAFPHRSTRTSALDKSIGTFQPDTAG